MNLERERKVADLDSYGPDPRTRISLSVPVFKELMGKNGLAFGQLETPLLARLEQQQWRQLYRMVQHPADCVELLRLFGADPELRAQVPALYLTATMNAGRFMRKQRRWAALADMVKAPWRWLMDRRSPYGTSSDQDPAQDLLLKLMADPELADRLVMGGLGSKGTQPKRARSAAGARRAATAPSAAAGDVVEATAAASATAAAPSGGGASTAEAAPRQADRR
ncbi:hypothetical protein [Rugamonas aquatica]|uniref:Uncharacterized protein n=1 Tax=Rugamonas aquatica TaxID=2743357 RepID=A0A6A7N652_9BURK|nr:hypothetical protein [Rugamonas aquatica]MQA40605.1 hypothetical protein [Rugamonas aquatica]